MQMLHNVKNIVTAVCFVQKIQALFVAGATKVGTALPKDSEEFTRKEKVIRAPFFRQSRVKNL